MYTFDIEMITNATEVGLLDTTELTKSFVLKNTACITVVY